MAGQMQVLEHTVRLSSRHVQQLGLAKVGVHFLLQSSQHVLEHATLALAAPWGWRWHDVFDMMPSQPSRRI